MYHVGSLSSSTLLTKPKKAQNNKNPRLKKLAGKGVGQTEGVCLACYTLECEMWMVDVSSAVGGALCRSFVMVVGLIRPLKLCSCSGLASFS